MKRVAVGTSRYLLPAVGILVILFIINGLGCRKEAPVEAGAPEANAPVPAGTPEANAPVPVGTPEANAPTETPGQAAVAPQPDKVIVTVNGTPITESQVQRRIDLEFKPKLEKLAAQSPELAAQQERMLRQSLANRLIGEQLLDEQVQAAQIQVTEEQAVAHITQQLGARNPPMSLQQYKAIVLAQGGDFEAQMQYIQRGMAYEKLLQAKKGAEINVTEEEAKKYYDENPKEFEVPEQVQASHILISTKPTDPNADPNEVKAQAKQKAAELLKQIKDGADFATLAREHSSCPSSARGGDLGLFARGSMVKPFEEAAFALKAGETSDVVETEFGYHIIKVAEHRDPNEVTFEDTKSTLLAKLTQQKKSEVMKAYLQSLRENAEIVFASDGTLPPSQPVITAPADANQE